MIVIDSGALVAIIGLICIMAVVIFIIYTTKDI